MEGKAMKNYRKRHRVLVYPADGGSTRTTSTGKITLYLDDLGEPDRLVELVLYPDDALRLATTLARWADVAANPDAPYIRRLGKARKAAES
jgi:hypothetical protein